jgi:energy-coupling factor transporter ATP-binding protein EcfA2
MGDSSVKNIRIIKNKSELEGTVYIELLPGAYNGVTWNEGSLFFEEETFGYLELALEKHAPDYNRYAFTEIKLDAWLEVIQEWKALQLLLQHAASVSDLRDQVGFIFQNSEQCFAEHFQTNKDALASIIKELCDWIDAKARAHSCVTVLGL